MSRYYGHLVIVFTDGTTERVGGNRHQASDGLLTVWTNRTYGGPADQRWFPLGNIREYRWDDDQ